MSRKSIGGITTGVLSVALMLLMAAGVAGAERADASVRWKYVLEDGGATITGCAEEPRGDLAIPDTIDGHPVTGVGDSAFEGCRELTSITIPDGVKRIGNWAFQKCSALSGVTIPGSVASIGDAAFTECSALADVYIPASVTSIGLNPFIECPLTSIDVSPDNPIFSQTDGVLFDDEQNLLVSYPGAKEGAYAVPEGVRSIGFSAFANCNGLTGINLPGTLTTIGEFAFYGCEGLTVVVIPDGVAEIATTAFDGCHNLTLSGKEGGYAEQYARFYGLRFACIETGQRPAAPEVAGILLDADSVNHISVGQTAYVALPENRTTPYWLDYDISDDSIMALDRDEYRTDFNLLNLSGVGGTHWYYFKALSPGACTIRMLLGRVSGDQEPDEVAVYAIVVHDAESSNPFEDMTVDVIPGAPASPAAEDIVGTWYCNAVMSGDFVMDTALWGTDMTWTFFADNTALRQKTGESDREGAWGIQDGRIVVTAGDAPEVFALVDGALVAEDFGLKAIYGREKQEAKPVELPALRDDVTLACFDGTWNAAAIHLEGITAPLALAGVFVATLAIDEGNVTFYVASSTSSQDEYAGALDGSALVASAQNAGQREMDTLTLRLHEDGTMRLVLSEDFFMFFQRAE